MTSSSPESRDEVTPRTELPEPAATIYRLTMKLRDDLAFAAPEMATLHMERRLAEAYSAGEAEAASKARVDTLRELEPVIRRAAEQPVGYGDWACVECRSTSGILVDGFQCAVHKARSVLALIEGAPRG